MILSSFAFAQTSRTELEKKKDKLVKEITSLQAELDKTKKNKNATLGQVTALKKKIAARETLIGTYGSEINLLDKDISKTRSQITAEAARLKDLQVRYARSVHYNYKHMGAYDGLMFVLSSRSFNDAFQRLKYLRRYAAYRRTQSNGIKEAVSQLSGKQTKLVAVKNEKKQLLTEEQALRNKLAQEKSEQDKLAKTFTQKEKKIKADLATKKKEQDKLKKKIEDAIRKEIAAATKAAAAKSGTITTKASSSSSSSAALTLTPEAKALSNSFAANQGKFPWPVEKGSYFESFGTHAHPQLANVTTKNNGVDILTNSGAAVRAVFKGKVVSILTNPVYHKAVIVRHGEYFTVYSNLETVNVKAGEELATKQTIGTVHTNADTKQATVHFEVWKGTVFMNPAGWLAKK